MLKNCWKRLKNCWKNGSLPKVRVRSATTSNWRCTSAHTCACAPKYGRVRCVRATQIKVASHTLQIRVCAALRFSIIGWLKLKRKIRSFKKVKNSWRNWICNLSCRFDLGINKRFQFPPTTQVLKILSFGFHKRLSQ